MMTRKPTPVLGDAALHDAAIGLLGANREARERLETATQHIIASAWNNGLSENQIAQASGWSRKAIKVRLRRADAAGLLHRRRFPADSGRPPRTAVA
jgi:predicted ArsR family transcriptional regulator